ncbi:MAG: precorrin-3B C(17)-methyltransferase [Alphaproteobacteria bacterium]|nr:precorrin-3B C(17)-methyltransferase [Alphaproteobacteria bacterium]
MTTPAIIVLTQAGLPVAERIRSALGRGEIHVLVGRVDGGDVAFETPTVHLRGQFQAGRPIVGICAAGILVRALAPVLTDKRGEPPVVAVAEDGSTAVPLLGGHHGANDLARRIARALDGVAAVTTAGDLRFGIALDTPPAGYVLANPADTKTVSAALLAGATVRLEGEAPWLADSELPLAPDGTVTLRVTARAEPGAPDRLVYHPATLAVGIGCERGCAPEELVDLVDRTLAEHELAPKSVALLVSLDLKADEPAVHRVAAHLSRPVRFFDADRLEAETPRLATPSDTVFREVGCHGVAEAAALAAAGADGTLLVAKHKSARATCAVAGAPAPIDPAAAGRPRGLLSVVGIGPGAATWRTPEAEQHLVAADDLVGYRGYLDLLGDSVIGKTRHDFDLGEEELRVRHALDLAARGQRVALVSSGDAGIYAMASLVFEVLDGGEDSGWRRVEVAVVPGISALQAAAARAGAPLGHDFCAISLSDLLTPWPAIERRVRAAAEGDFVVAFYNPVSQRRRDQLARARDILLDHRSPTTPVVLARNLGRDGEAVRHCTLGALDPGDIDMLTLVLVGSTETRRFGDGDERAWVYTPRGYSGKGEADRREKAS